MKNVQVGLQVYTVSDELRNNYVHALEKIAAIGYSVIEIGGFGPFSIAEWKKTLKDLNLSVVANHIPFEMLEESFNHIAEFNLGIGNRNIVCPYLREEVRQNADGYKRVAESLNRIGEKCKSQGMALHYHNHSFEFMKFDGKCGLDILFDETEPQLVMFELDTYWVTHGGADPAEYFKKFAGRCRLVHLKDMTADEERTFAEVGEGMIDFTNLFRIAGETEIECFIVEQDICKRPSLESAKISFENIKKIAQNSGIIAK